MMLSPLGKKITKDVDDVINNKNIKSLLQKYPDKFEREFIQKYAEIKMAFFSSKFTLTALYFALLSIALAIILSFSLVLYPDDVQKSKSYIEFIFKLWLFVSFILMYLCIRGLYTKNLLDYFKDIIFAIEDDNKLRIKKQDKSLAISKNNKTSEKAETFSNNSVSDIKETDIKINKNDVQLKFHKILEEHRWITTLIWNKIHTLILVNGILFSAFNLLVIADLKSDYFIQKSSLSIVGFVISIFWFFTLNHSLIYKENYRNQIFQIQLDYPELSINFIDEHNNWGGIFGTNGVAKISTISLSILWLIILYSLKIGFL